MSEKRCKESTPFDFGPPESLHRSVDWTEGDRSVVAESRPRTGRAQLGGNAQGDPAKRAFPLSNRGAGVAEKVASHGVPPARPVAPAPPSPFILLIPDAKYGELSDAEKVYYYALLRGQFRRLLQVARKAGLDPADILDAIWGAR